MFRLQSINKVTARLSRGSGCSARRETANFTESTMPRGLSVNKVLGPVLAESDFETQTPSHVDVQSTQQQICSFAKAALVDFLFLRCQSVGTRKLFVRSSTLSFLHLMNDDERVERVQPRSRRLFKVPFKIYMIIPGFSAIYGLCLPAFQP